MSFYNVFSLPVPAGFVDATPVKINSHGFIVGTCDRYAGPTSAMVWTGSGYTVIGPPGFSGHGTGINSNNVMVGNYVNGVQAIPFFWKTGVLTALNTSAQSGALGTSVLDINDNNEMTGYEHHDTPPWEAGIFWNGISAVPVKITSQNIKNCVGINNNGVIIGTLLDPSYKSKGFYWDPATQSITIIPNSMGCFAINDLTNPQILAYWNLNSFHSYMYDSATNAIFDLNGGEDFCAANDINNNSEIVGNTDTDGAVMWNGLIKIKLNDPSISNAQLKGWNLTQALSINDKGSIAARGIFNGKESPCVLIPRREFQLRHLFKIPLQHIFPDILWPGQIYDAPRPKGWPKQLPFPLPKPSPFEMVGQAYKMKQDIQNALQIINITNELPNKETGKAIKKIVNVFIRQQVQQLTSVLKKSLGSSKR